MVRKLQTIIAATVVASSLSTASGDAITLTEMSTLANAMETAYFDINHYVTLENLNDLSQLSTTLPFDSIRQNGGVFPIDPFIGTFKSRRDFTLGTLTWNGPYVTYQSNRIQSQTEPYDQGSLLDRWGSPYLLFNPHGLLRGDQGRITQEYYGDAFDRYTIVSLGPDGILGTDDVIYQFGPAIQGAFLTSLSGTSTTMVSAPLDDQDYEIEAGSTVTLHGMNLNPPNPEKAVLFGATVIPDVISWSAREVVIIAPAQQTGNSEEFRIQLGTNSIGGIKARITGSNTTVSNWVEY